MQLFAYVVVFIMLFSCGNTQEEGVQGAGDGWQEELLLQVDELRQKQIALEKEVVSLKAQLAEAPSKPKSDGKVSDILFRAPYVLGDKNAKVAILEFSDFECPYCARHAKNVFPKLKSEFMDKGIVQYGLSDYPLSFHAGAKGAAAAVRCAGEQDTIHNNDWNSSGFDVAKFESVAVEDLWFSRQGSNLLISVVGTNDQLTVEGWYNGYGQQLDQIQVGASVLQSNKVDLLVSAMASFAVPSGVGSVVPANVEDTLQPILATAWTS